MTEQRNIVLNVKGMTCEGCAGAVQRIVQKADPQALVAVHLPTGRVVAKTALEPAKLAAAITAGGYAAEPA